MSNKIFWLFRPLALLALFLVVASLLLVVSHKMYSDRKVQLKVSIENNLKTIAELKAAEIHTWLSERLADASVQSHSALYSDLNVFSNQKLAAFHLLKERLQIVKQHYHYENIILVDPKLQPLLSLNDSITELSSAVKSMLNEKLMNEPGFKLYKSDKTNHILFDFYCAIQDEKNVLLGYLILRVDPNLYLYPTITKWPVVSHSAETIILERSGDSVQSLNDVKYRSGTALKPLISIKQTTNPGVNAVLGGPHLFEGNDYRSVPVLSYWNPIQGTNWKIIAKEDLDEIYEPLYNLSWAFGIILTILLLFLASILVLIRILYQRSYLKSLYEAELEKKKTQAELDQSLIKYKALFDDSPDAYLITREGKFIECNKAAEMLIGGTKADILGKSPLLISPEFQPNGLKSADMLPEVVRVAYDTGNNSFEWMHKRPDGSEFLTLLNLSLINYEDRPALFVTWKDITKTRAAEEQVRKLSRAVEQSPTSVVITNLEGEIEYANPMACRTTGYSLEELIGKNPRVLKSGETELDEYQQLWDNITHGTQWRGVFHNKRKNGELYWESSTISPIVDATGRTTHYVAVKEDITEKKKAEEELKKFQTISDNANYGNAIADLNGILWYSNHHFAAMHGYEVSEIVGKNLSMLHSEHQMIRVMETIELLQREGEFHTEEVWRTRKNGTIFPSMMNAMIIHDKDGLPQYMSATVIDITEQKNVENALRESEERLNYAQQIANMGSWSLNFITGKTNWSKNYYRIIGIEPEEVADKNEYFRKIIHPDDLHLLDDKLGEIIRDRKPISFELRLLLPDGTLKWIQNNLAPNFEGDQLVSLEGVNIDITEKKIKEAEINKLSQAVEQSPIIVVITDLAGEIVYVNPAFEMTTGFSKQEVIGQNPRILNSGLLDFSFFTDLWSTIVSGQEWKGELINKKRNGELYWEQMTITPIHDSTGKISNYLAVKQDITDKKANEQKILDLNAGLEQKIAERTAQLSQSNEELAQEIKERISIEKALTIKSMELESFFNVALDLLCIASTSGQFIKVNRAWEHILGYSSAELEHRLFLDFIHPDDLPKTLEAMGELSQQHQIINFINRYKTKDGSYRFIEWRSAPSGELIYAAARDITERKRKEDFELELLQLSTQLTGIKSSEIKRGIQLSLERIGRYTGSDRTFIFELNPAEETFTNTYEWNRDESRIYLSTIKTSPVSMFPKWWEELRKGQFIHISNIEELPDSWQSEKDNIRPYGDQSILAIPMFSENQLIGYVGLASISERKIFSSEEINLLTIWGGMLTSLINNFHTESLLELTRKNYETFFNTLDDFLWVLDKEGMIIHFNDTAYKRLEYSLEELKGESVLKVHPVERREEARAVLDQLLAGSSQLFSIPLMSKSGKLIPVETRAMSGFWNGQPVIFEASKDISQIKLSEEKFATAFHSNSAMMAISRFDNGAYVDVNKAFTEVLGYSREELIGKSNKELALFPDLNIRLSIINDLENNIPVRKIEVPFRTKSGQIKIGLLSADTIMIGETKCLISVTIDISERKEMEEQLKHAQEEANKASVAKSEFLSRMSHELRTPMNSILGFAQLLEMGELNGGQQKGVKHILNSGKHLLELINEVLEISRIEAGKLSLSPEPIQISNVIHEMMEIVWPLARDRKLTLDLIGSPVNQFYVLADRQRLKQVLLNLINNAIKYNKIGGSIKVSTSLITGNTNDVVNIRISVTDTGIGIHPESLPHLFNPFERIGADKSNTEGTGLGLAVAKKLVEAMGGTVGVESIYNEGSTFWIELPQAENQLKQLDKLENFNELENGLGNKSGTILYIEDNLPNIELIEQILFAHCKNIKLISNMNGKEAVRMAKEYNPDMILLDLNLPDIHGSEVLVQLRSDQNTSAIPVIVISADATPQQLEKLMKRGANDYLTKPLDVRILLKLINSTIKNK